MRFSKNPAKNTGIIWFVITIGSFLLMILFAAVFLPSGFTFGRFFPVVLLGCVSFLGIIFAPTFYWSGKKLDSLMAGKDLLARWSYRPGEFGSMLEDEKKRQKKIRVVVLFFVCLCLGMGVLFCYAWGRWDFVAVSEYVLLLMLTLVFMYAGLPAMGFGPANAMDMYLGRNSVLVAVEEYERDVVAVVPDTEHAPLPDLPDLIPSTGGRGDEGRDILLMEVDRRVHDTVQPSPFRIGGQLDPGDLVTPVIGTGQQVREARMQPGNQERCQQEDDQDRQDRPLPPEPCPVRGEGDRNGGEREDRYDAQRGHKGLAQDPRADVQVVRVGREVH